MEATLNRASREWATRPDDQRYLTLESLFAAVAQRKRESWTVTPHVRDLGNSDAIVPFDEERLGVEVYDPTRGERVMLSPSHWAFGQLALYAKAPAAYLRNLPAPLAAINLQWGLGHNPVRDDALLLAHSNGDNTLRAITSTSYGRIWDAQVIQAVMRANANGRWQVPAASYSGANPKRATTLYASDRDVFIFLVDPKNPIEIPGEQPMFRGFFAWNSEVGAATFGLTTFLYRYVCDNRIVWGASDVKELRIRHTGGAPERFAYEGERLLQRYADESTAKLVAGITAAKNAELPDNGKPESVMEWLQKRNFAKGVAKASLDAAVAEEGQARSVWDIVNGITAYARSIPHTDARIELETAAGKLLSAVAG